MYSRIIVPLDGSPLAEGALPYALTMGSAAGAAVILMQVLPSSERMHDHYLRYNAAMEAEHLAAAATALEARARSLSRPSLPVDSYLAVGDAAEEIVRYAERGEGSCIVMATHGRGGALHWAFGSVARKVLTTATAPTLIVRSEAEPRQNAQPAAIRSILVPLDGSKLAEAAVPHARDLAQELGARVTLVRAISPPITLIACPYEPIIAAEYYDETMEQMRTSAQEYVRAIGSTFSAAGIATDTVVRQGGAPMALLEMLGTKEYDLVVMSTHGRTGVKRWVLGSVAERLVEASHTPVLLVRSIEQPTAE